MKTSLNFVNTCLRVVDTRRLPREEAKGETGFSKKDSGLVKLLETIGGVPYTLFPSTKRTPRLPESMR
jgi:hypothetical protein